MSSVVVQVGQCGNQIGQEFWNLLGKDLSTSQGNGLELWPSSVKLSVLCV